jgi:2-iminobutanoate/2-iminopropanoate deaminase
MSKKVIESDLAPAAIGPYSQAVAANGLLFVSGQLGIDASTGEMPEDIVEQTKLVLKNIDAILKKAGCGPASVLKTTVLLDDMANFGVVNELYGQYFVSPYPARACFAVKQLPKNAKVEIECIVMLE